jgi:4-hydroxyphenylpyruvate dioxygenase
MKFLNEGFDHVEFVVGDLHKHVDMWTKMGFESIAEVNLAEKHSHQVVMAQGMVRLVLTKNHHDHFFMAHGDGISVLGAEVENVQATYDEVVSRGARSAMKPQTFKTADGEVTYAEVFTPADFRYRFVSRKNSGNVNKPALFLDGLTVSKMESPSPTGIYRIDHLTNNIDMGQFDTWLAFYTQVFGFKAVRRFNIKTGRTGLLSDVVQSECGKIKVPINEATEKESQVQEFVDRFKGAGVQHLAFATKDIINGLKIYKERGFEFLTVPSTYYEVVPTRVPGVTEDLKVLEKLGILLDGEGGGYLMQIFSKELVGPFFMELIQRKGNDGFGEGNFRALFEAIERDQINRGVLKA